MFGLANRRAKAGGPQYDLRIFQTNDARQFAFDDYLAVPNKMSGLAGLVPLWGMIGAEAPRGFDYTTNLVGLGGTPSPVSNVIQSPLVYHPEFATTFLREFTGRNF